MKKKPSPLDLAYGEVEDEEVLEEALTDAVEEIVPDEEVAETDYEVTVKAVTEVTLKLISKDGKDGKWLCMNDNAEGFLVPSERCVDAVRTPFVVQLDEEVEILYNWDEEILSIVGNLDKIAVHRRVFWMAHAFRKEDFQNPSIARQVLKTGFAYAKPSI